MNVERSLHHGAHTLRLVVTKCGLGWHVREEENVDVIHDVVQRDWHRVERALSLFNLKAALLEQQGWVDDGTARWRHIAPAHVR